MNNSKTKVKDILNNIDSTDSTKVLKLLTIKEEIDKKIRRLKEELNDSIKKMQELMDCDFEKIEIREECTWYTHLVKWKCGKANGGIYI